ncbi:MAG TPA: hypothetical protein VF731_05145 [Solirubrobacterales bacterium]
MRLLTLISGVFGWLLVTAASALAISAPIHIANTGGEGVFIRPEPNTSHPAVGWIPEGASPDYNCFVWGQNINGVPIWFNVNYNGKTGYYASYYDDSSYHSNEELTAKYGIPLCGSSPPPSPPPASPGPSPAPSPSPPGPPSPAAPPVAIYFSPYNKGDSNGLFELNDGATKTFYLKEWESHCEEPNSEPRRPYQVASHWAGNQPIRTIAAWSKGRVGVISYLWNANQTQLRQLNYVLLIDPGYWAQMTCDRTRAGGAAIARWLQANTKAHLVIISSTEITQQENSRGIQESYFNAIRAASGNLSPRVLVCNYSLPNNGHEAGHNTAFWTSKYWIQHEIGSTRNACPQLSLNGSKWNATAGWHPVNN